MQNKTITYQGIISAVCIDTLTVQVTDEFSCDVCQIKKLCYMAEQKDKEIVIPCITDGYNVGDKIMIVSRASIGMYAVIFAFLLPLFEILTALIVAFSFGVCERQTALIALSTLVVHYWVMYLFRNKFNQSFTFTIQ